MLVRNFFLRCLRSTKVTSMQMMSTVKNPYHILGVNYDADFEYIKKAYRGFAQKYHPDKNSDPQAAAKFVYIKQAYEILIDEDKRNQYDRDHGVGKDSRTEGFAKKNPFDEFDYDVYRDRSRTQHETFTAGSSRKRKGENIVQEIKLSFMDAIKGGKLNLEFNRKSTCIYCHGNRCKPGTAPTRCLTCGGSGSSMSKIGGVAIHNECKRCQGLGLIIKYPCHVCKAKGSLVIPTKETIDIPPGTLYGYTITFRDKGNLSENGPNGDLLVKVSVDKHPQFRVRDDDILATEWITISQAALGHKKYVNTIWGKCQLVIPAGTQDGSKIHIKYKGVLAKRIYGDHIVSVRIHVPTKLNETQRKIFYELAKVEDPVNKQAPPPYSNDKEDTQDKKKESEDIFEKLKKAFL